MVIRAEMLTELPKVPEPFLPDSLGDTDGTDPDWNAKALEELANQLGVMNDYYYPLIGSAQELRHQRAALNSGDPVLLSQSR